MVDGSNSTKRGSDETRKTLHSSFKPAPRLEQVGTNIPSARRIANIDPNDVMILSHDTNFCRMKFSESSREARCFSHHNSSFLKGGSR
jgi:hypothetical protein